MAQAGAHEGLFRATLAGGACWRRRHQGWRDPQRRRGDPASRIRRGGAGRLPTAGIHTAIETCGAAAWERWEQGAAQADLVLYDGKLVHEAAHRRGTGASNRLILDNLARLAEAGADIQVRVPLIPGITDTAGNIGATYALMERLGLRRIALLPYNPAAGAKYEWLDREYALVGEVQSCEMLEALAAPGHAAGLEVEIG